jgi:hypothetical protein
MKFRQLISEADRENYLEACLDCAMTVLLLGEYEFCNGKVRRNVEELTEYTGLTIKSQAKLWDLDPKDVFNAFDAILKRIGAWQ